MLVANADQVEPTNAGRGFAVSTVRGDATGWLTLAAGWQPAAASPIMARITSARER